MRPAFFILPLAAALLCCRSPAPPVSEADLRGPEAASLRPAFEEGSSEAEARLAAAGPEGAAEVRSYLVSPDRGLRLRALEVLLSAGEDIDLTERERVELALFELTRADAQPWSGLRAFGRLREMGAEAVPALREAAMGEDKAAEAARRLLREWVP